jgi:hypothetical protein
MNVSRLKAVVVILVLGVLTVGCQSKRDYPGSYSVYQVVLADLLETVQGTGDYDGTEIAVSPSQVGGTGNVFSSGISVDKDLLLKLEATNEVKRDFEQAELALEGVRIEEIPSFDAYYYYRNDNRPKNVKCLVQFWRAGFSDDGSQAVVKFWYGPSSHGAIGTYVLHKAKNRWKIEKSTIDYYL